MPVIISGGSGNANLSGDTGLSTSNISSAANLTLTTQGGVYTVTVPNTTGTIALTSQLPVSGPAFSAYTASSGVTIGNGATKVTYDTEEFDTNNNFSSSRFTPTVAGYYQINAQLQPNSSYTGGYIAVYKNGSVYKLGNYVNTAITYGGFTVSSLVYCNGTTDYIEIYGAFTTSQAAAAGGQFTWVNGFLARPA